MSGPAGQDQLLAVVLFAPDLQMVVPVLSPQPVAAAVGVPEGVVTSAAVEQIIAATAVEGDDQLFGGGEVDVPSPC